MNIVSRPTLGVIAAAFVTVVLTACGGSSKTVTQTAAPASSAPKYTAESVKSKVQRELVRSSTSADSLNGKFDPVTANCIAEAATELNCDVDDTNIAGGPLNFTVIVDPITGETRITGHGQ